MKRDSSSFIHRQLRTSEAIQDLALRSLNQLLFYRILKGLKIEKVRPEFLECNNKYRGAFIRHSMLMDLARQPEYELPQTFLNQALSNGDECYGFFHGSVLAAYSWYSRKPTQINPADLILHFDHEYIYMYKGFTHPNFRGQGLYGIGMTRALDTYLARGYKGLLCYVESNNFTSLKSCYRIGYSDFGNLYVARLFDRYWLHSDPGCQRYGFALERVRSLRGVGISATA